MAKLKKVFKIIIFILVTVVLLVLTYAALVYFHIITPPNFMPAIPYIQEKANSPADKKVSELDRVKHENDILKKKLTDQQDEIKLLKNDLKDIENKQLANQKAIQKADEEYKDKIIALNEKLSQSQQTKTNQESTYKDMAKYFKAMSTKDAADLLGRLNEDDIIGILGQIDTDTAAELLQKMPRDKAASITKKMLVTSPQ